MSKRDKIKDLIVKRLKEESATGTGASWNPGNSGENYPTPVAGEAPNYYYKLGFKPVKTTKPKSFDKKQLWKEGEEITPEFDIESFVSSLPTEDEKLKKYIVGRLGDYNELADKLKQIISLMRDAKKKDINRYKNNPKFEAVYATDLAKSLLDDIIELFTK
jgi:hypothetical protein